MKASLVEQLLNGLGMGLTYSLVGMGYHLTFGVLNIANLAYGELCMVGAMSALFAFTVGGAGPVAAGIVGVGVATALGLAVFALAIVPLGRVEDPNSDRHVWALVSTMGASLVIQYAALLAFGPYPQPFPQGGSAVTVPGLSVSVTPSLVTNLVASTAIILGVAAMLRHTPFGLRLRALTANLELARACGIRVARDQALCIALSSGLAGLAGVLVCGQVGSVSPFIGAPYGIKGLTSLILGRSLAGTAVVAIGLGLAEAVVAGFVSSSYRDAIVYSALIVFAISSARGRGRTF